MSCHSTPEVAHQRAVLKGLEEAKARGTKGEQLQVRALTQLHDSHSVLLDGICSLSVVCDSRKRYCLVPA